MQFSALHVYFKFSIFSSTGSDSQLSSIKRIFFSFFFTLKIV